MSLPLARMASMQSETPHPSFEKAIIRKIKRPLGFARWSAYVLESDTHGLWLYSPQGTLFRSQVGERIGECEVGQGDRPAGLPVLHLIPHTGWWLAEWHRDEREAIISIDICKKPTAIEGEWHYIDLELDLLARNGRVEIHDEDEFVAACAAGFISSDEAQLASETTREIERLLRQHCEPFGGLGWEKLAAAERLGLPPIRALSQVSTT